FKSDAMLEVIQAQSKKLRGVIDPANNGFAWSVEVNSFEGFNGPLQREHFNENYLESVKYPRATFTGKIIEKVDFQQDGTYTVRAKGQLSVHGVEQERIIKSTLELKGRRLIIRSSFSVPLSDHSISIPKIVHQKIAEEIQVSVEAELQGS
ncbi:MAG TPA: YceI family protein, partial [Saprospiraceae bacterium]|nr:YceI family protein [Saprospiraceae bacterium]